MHNKKSQWMWIVGAVMAVLLIVVGIALYRQSFGAAKSNIATYQSCEGQRGECKEVCGSDEISHYKALGCGSGDYKDKPYCCQPPDTYA